jgi:hypothetical protein
MLMAQQKKSINIFNAVPIKISGINGLTFTSQDNVFSVTGTATGSTPYGNIYIVNGLKPNVKYSFRLQLLNKNNSSGKFEARFYIFTRSPATYLVSPCSIWSLNGSEAVGTYTFTEEQIAKGIECGVYFNYNTTSVFDNISVRADIIEGEYTKDTMPPYEPYEE